MEALEIISIESDDHEEIRSNHAFKRRRRSPYEDENRNKRIKTRHKDKEDENRNKRIKTRHEDKERNNETEDNSSDIIELFSDFSKRKKGKRKKKKRRRSKSYYSYDDKQNHRKKRVKKEIFVNVDSDSERKLLYERKDYSHSSHNYLNSEKRAKYKNIHTNRYKKCEGNKKEDTNLDHRSKYKKLDNRQNEWEKSKKEDHRQSQGERSGKSRYENCDRTRRQSETEKAKYVDHRQNDREILTCNNMDQRQIERSKLDDINCWQSQRGRYENCNQDQNEMQRSSNKVFGQRQVERERTKSVNVDHEQSKRGRPENFDHMGPSNRNNSRNENDNGSYDVNKNVCNDRGQKYQVYEVNDTEDKKSSSSVSNIITLKKALKRIESNGRTENRKGGHQENNERELGSSLYKNTDEILRWIKNTERESAKDLYSEPDITSSIENEMHRDAEIDIIEADKVNDEPSKNNLHSINTSLITNTAHQKRPQDYHDHEPHSSRSLKRNQENQCQTSKNQIQFTDSQSFNSTKLDNRDKSSEIKIQNSAYNEKRLPRKENSDFVSILEKFPNLQKQMELASSYKLASSNTNILSKSIVKNTSQNNNSQLNPSHSENVLCDTEIPSVTVHSQALSSKDKAYLSTNNIVSKKKSSLYNGPINFSSHDKKYKDPIIMKNRNIEKEIKYNNTNILSESVEKSIVMNNSQNKDSQLIPSQSEIVLCDREITPDTIHSCAVSSIEKANLRINNILNENKSSLYIGPNNFSTHDKKDNDPNYKKNRNNEKDIKDNDTNILSESIERSIVQNNSQNKDCQLVPSRPNKQEQEKNDLIDRNRPRALLNPSKSWNLRIAAAKEKNKSKVNLHNKNLIERINNNKSSCINEKDVNTSSTFTEGNKIMSDNIQSFSTDVNTDFEKYSFLASSVDILKPTILKNKCSTLENVSNFFEIGNVQGNYNDNDDASVNDLDTTNLQTSEMGNSDFCDKIKKENAIIDTCVDTVTANERDDKRDARVSCIKEEISFSNEIHLEIYDQVDSKAFIRSMVLSDGLDKNNSLDIAQQTLPGFEENLPTKVSDVNLPALEDDLPTRVPDDEDLSGSEGDLPTKVPDDENLSESNEDLSTKVSDSKNLSVSEEYLSTRVSNDENFPASDEDLSTRVSKDENLPALEEDLPTRASTMFEIGCVWSIATASKENTTHYPIPEDLAEVIEIGRVEVTATSACSFSIKKESSEQQRNYYVSHTDIEHCPMCQRKLNEDQFKFNPETMILTMVCFCTLTIYQLINPETYNDISIR